VQAQSYARLFHELDHSQRNINGNPGHGEGPTIAESNLFHSERGLPQRAGHAGGCANTAKPPSCLIVTAAAGSMRAPQVRALQHARDTLLRTNPLGNLLECAIYTAYMTFSPEVAADIRDSPPLRRTLLDLLIEPLIEYLLLAQRHVEARGALAAVRSRLAGLRRDYQQRLGEREIAAIAALLERWAGELARGEATAIAGVPGDEADHAAALRYLVAAVNRRVPGNPFVVWAIAAPVAAFWRLLAAADDETAESLFVDGLHDWLAAVPLPEELKRMPRETMRSGLAGLAESFLIDPALRGRLSARLLDGLAGDVGYDLQAVLVQAGYPLA
jgi:hypothetical protein